MSSEDMQHVKLKALKNLTITIGMMIQAVDTYIVGVSGGADTMDPEVRTLFDDFYDVISDLMTITADSALDASHLMEYKEFLGNALDPVGVKEAAWTGGSASLKYGLD